MRLKVAVGCWVVAVALLAAVPLAAQGDPEGLAAVPEFAGPAWWLGLMVITLQATVLQRQPAIPRGAVVAVALGAPAGALVGLQDAVGVTSVAVLVATFLLVVGEPLRELWGWLAAAAALVALGQVLAQVDAGSDVGPAVSGGLVQGVGTVGVAVLVGAVVRARREVSTAREERLEALRREQAALVEVAVARERTAMARELHDIAAHHLSGITMVTGALARQIDTDPEGAKAAVREVRAHSKELLRDLRGLVTLLREGPADDADRQETLAGVGALVEAARRTGADVRLTVDTVDETGAVGAGVGPLAQLSAYRTVQEALANSARHAGGAPCEVVVDDRGEREVVVSVRNGAGQDAGPGGGLGLVGMRERAELTGAELSAGPTPEGGWLVELRLPRG
ncbi:sensor histidine kinase [Nocardioides anomalus]|uniref:histidine kinase n=1 Tax=Nocardioides anomalus TaxID=2712223 RepID=A0A6G6W8M8_9ACTN|nr:histidine kinase [Nocardioides anomalus]QIG41572.1 sensor histidine kinase [Nocardioides anomalus]